MTTYPIIQDSAVISSARDLINFIGEIKNTQIGEVTLRELKSKFQFLVDAYNSIPSRAFPVDIIDESIDKISFEIRSTYFSKLKFSEVASFVIGSLKEAENHMDDGQCLDTLLINLLRYIFYFS